MAGETMKVVCREFAYRQTIKTGARTQHYLIDASTWEIIKPTRKVRSRTGAHGEDVYCLPQEAWNNVIIVSLERSNSGKLYYDIVASQSLAREVSELRELLYYASDFSEMVETVHEYVKAKKLSQRA
jgi:hypothetical protein